ncbi:MAG: response regulator transcription factor [Phaeodactylibacter sp.]|nr:response regulator transcription factor [Phaeodactylibacter sp.]
MTPLKDLIIDDEPLAHKVILEYAKAVPFLEICGQCYLPTEALSFLQQTPVDLLFLDIQMPRIKGLDFLRALSQRPLVIITSAYEEYALESYELEVCDYLLKPFRFERFLKAVNRALERQQPKQQAAPVSAESPMQEQLFLKVDKRLVQVEVNAICYLESYGNYVKVWLEDQYYLTPRTMASFEPELPDSYFFRIHKSFILNRTYIDYVEGHEVILKNGKHLPIGKSQRTAFKNFIS